MHGDISGETRIVFECEHAKSAVDRRGHVRIKEGPKGEGARSRAHSLFGLKCHWVTMCIFYSAYKNFFSRLN